MSDVEPLKIGDRVQVASRTARESLVPGIVRHYDEDQDWYYVEFELGPPWRGIYLASELAPVETGEEE